MSTFFAAPYPNIKVTSVLPDAELGDGRASESSIQIKRTRTGTVKTYVRSSNRQTLTLQFSLTRMKDLELIQFTQAFHTTDWRITLYDGSQWQAKLVGEPIRHTATTRYDTNNADTGDELIEVSMTFSALKLN